MRKFSLLLCALLLCASAYARESNTANTFALSVNEPSPPANIADLAWLVGHWRGTGLGGTVEELWSPAAGGAMLGLFRLLNENKPEFYEFCVIDTHEGSLRYRVKHFDPQLQGWESKDKSVDFALVGLEPGAAYFEGLTMRTEGPAKLTVYVAIKHKDGTVQEAQFDYARVVPPQGELHFDE